MKGSLLWLRFHLRGIGLLGWAGLALIAGAMAYVLAILPQHNAALDSLHADIEYWQQQRLAIEQQKNVANTPTKAVAVIPPLATTPALLLAIEDMARKDGLELKRSDYRYVDPAATNHVQAKDAGDQRGQLVEVRITAPASGSYRNIRAFIAHVMAHQPMLALDDMSLKRESIANGAVQAQLRFTLFVRGES